jgi:hypothetical protein
MASVIDEDLEAQRFWRKSRCQWTRRCERGREKPRGDVGIHHRVDTDKFQRQTPWTPARNLCSMA